MKTQPLKSLCVESTERGSKIKAAISTNSYLERQAAFLACKDRVSLTSSSLVTRK